MNNETRQIIGFVLVVLSAMISIALLPQPDFAVPPVAKYVLAIINAGITAAALYLNVRMPGQSSSG